MRIKLRPHHILCSFCFAGNGYSDEFINNLTRIVNTLESSKNDEIEIEIIQGTDDICAHCPNCHDQKCTTKDKVNLLDKFHTKVLGINFGDILTWNKCKQMITSKITLSILRNICNSCSWLESGICGKIIKKKLNASK